MGDAAQGGNDQRPACSTVGEGFGASHGWGHQQLTHVMLIVTAVYRSTTFFANAFTPNRQQTPICSEARYGVRSDASASCQGLPTIRHTSRTDGN